MRFQRTDLTIDARNGTFMIEEFSEGDDLGVDDTWVGPLNSPTKFYNDLCTSDVPVSLRDEIRSMSLGISELIRRLASRYKSAIDRGYAAVEARPNSILNDFERLDPDQAKRLKILSIDRDFDVPGRDESVELDDAVGPNGEQLYSLCIVANNRPVALPDKQKDSGRIGRPETVDHDILEQVVFDLMRAKGTPGSTKPAWTGEIFAQAVIKRMAERGLQVSRATVLKKKPLLIENYKKSLPRNSFQQSHNSKISKH
jgi:hypothetical protein